MENGLIISMKCRAEMIAAVVCVHAPIIPANRKSSASEVLVGVSATCQRFVSSLRLTQAGSRTLAPAPHLRDVNPIPHSLLYIDNFLLEITRALSLAHHAYGCKPMILCAPFQTDWARL